MTNPNIRLLFIRKYGSAKNDDRVTISRLGANQFNLSYTYGESESKTPHQLVLTDRAVFRWVRNVIGLLEKDSDPFESVQVDFPSMPTVLFEVSKLAYAYDHLLDAIEFHLDNWPAVTHRLFLDEEEYDDDEEYEEDEEYADMPPLIPSPVDNYSYFNTDQRGSQHLFMD